MDLRLPPQLPRKASFISPAITPPPPFAHSFETRILYPAASLNFKNHHLSSLFCYKF